MRFTRHVSSRYLVCSSGAKAAVLKYAEDRVDTDEFFEKWKGDDQAHLRQGGVDQKDWRAELRKTFEKFKESFDEKARDTAEGLILWRCIDVPDAENFAADMEGKSLGVYWSYTRDGAICYEGKGGDRITLKAIVPLGSIDMERNLLANVDWINWDEMEITLRKGKPVRVVEIDGEETDVNCKA